MSARRGRAPATARPAADEPGADVAGGPAAGGGGALHRPADDRYPWIAMAVVLIGSFMVILDTTIVNVALPQIGIALGRQSGIEWIATAYLLAVGVCQPGVGWFADRFGRKRVFVVSLGLFTTSSLLAALSPNLETLVVFRVLQGLGGGALMPVGMATIYELFPPHRRGTALGVWGVAAMGAPAFGPVIGGYLVTAVSWHWLFLVNVPIGALGMVAATRLLRDTGYREERPFDGAGLALATTGLVCWLLAFAQANEWGWGSARILGLLGGGAVLVVLFVRRELRIPHPAVDVRMFQVRLFSLTIVIIMGLMAVQFGILVFLPLQLQTLHGMTALRVGTLLAPMALAASVTFLVGGRITDRIGPRVPVIAGSVLLAVSAWRLGHLGLEASLLEIEVAVVLQGLGFGFALMPNSVTGMNVLSHRFVAQASAVRQLAVRVAASFAVAVLATIVAMRMGAVSPAGPDDIGASVAQAAYNTVFLIVCGIAVGTALLGLFLPGRQRTLEIQETRAREQEELALDVT